MTKYIAGYCDMSYVEHCNYLDVLPLSYRREILDLILLLKNSNGAINVDYIDDFCFYNVEFQSTMGQPWSQASNKFCQNWGVQMLIF